MLGFILGPEEFKGFIEYCKGLSTRPDRDEDELYEQYESFYTGLVATTPPSNYLKRDNISHISLRSFVCGLTPENATGFVINPANMVHWPHYRKAVRISGWAVQITLQKGVSVDKEDEKGKYFIYEDIQLHSPQSYPLFQQITAYIRSITKPLRFDACVVNDVDEIKPPVRISKQVAADLANSWIFKEYEFKIRSYH